MIVFDGHDIESLFVCGDPEITVFSFENELRPLKGGGSAFAGGRMASTSVSFAAAAIGSAQERRAAISTLGSWLDVDSPKWLCLPDMPDWQYLAIPDGAVDLSRHIDGEDFTLTFLLVDPVAYGMERTVTVPSGGSVTFMVEGTHPTYPKITANAVRNSTSLVWGLKLDEVDFIHVATGNASARSVALDCKERTCVVNSSVSLPTLDSDWLEFTPGKHTLRMDNGTGAATVTFVERWL